MVGSQYHAPSGDQDPRRNSGQGPGYHYEYNYNYSQNFSPGSGRSPKRDNGWRDWIGIIILFMLPLGITQVVAVILAIHKIVKMSRQERTYYYRQYRNAAERIRDDVQDLFRGRGHSGFSGSDAHFQGQNPHAQPGGQQAWAAGPGQRDTAQPGPEAGGRTSGPTASHKDERARARNAARKRADAEDRGSTGLIIAGAITAGIFGLGAASILIELLDRLVRGYFFSEDLIGVLACALFCAGGLAMLLAGIGGKNRQARYFNYLAYIGSNEEVNLAHMAATFDVSVRKLCKDLRRMLSKGILPTGYLDLAEGKLYLTSEGYRAQPGPQSETPPSSEQQPSSGGQREDDILREIRQINDEIDDEVMSAKITRIEDITGKILAYQKSHPNREGKLRPFLSYYLPTTLKILRAYAQLESQGVEGENITAATQRIEGMMDQVVAGFEKQLDRLFQDDAMDITSDVQVLENMLKKDGLSDDSMTMPL